MSKVSLIDPSAFKLNIMGANVEGFSKGTFITITRNDPVFSQKRSLKGNTQVRKYSNSYYTLKFTLDSGVSSNTWIHVLHNLQETYGIAFPIPILFKDNMGTSTFFCNAAYIQEPDVTFGTESTTREWNVICNNVSNVIGSNQQDSSIDKILTSIRATIGTAGALGVDVDSFVNMALDSAASLISNRNN